LVSDLISRVLSKTAGTPPGRIAAFFYAFLLSSVISILAMYLIRSGGVSPPADLTAVLPMPEMSSPAVVFSASRGGMPMNAARMLAKNFGSREASALAVFLPILENADSCALAAEGRAEGWALYGAFSISLEDRESLSARETPESWKRHLVMPDLLPTDREGLFRMHADNAAAPIYVGVDDEYAFIAGTLSDADRIIELRDGAATPSGGKWSVEPEWKGHVLIRDGGMVSALLAGQPWEQNARNAINLEAAWNVSGDLRQTTAKWRASGLENVTGKAFAGSLKPHDWSGEDVFIPDPLIMSLAANMPPPGRNFSSLPGAVRKYAQEPLRKMGLRNSDIQAMLTGPAVISLGGRTQLLWFELPGLVLDLPGRGEAAHRFIDKFWSEFFTGAEPRPVDGYASGGAADLPFTVMGAANGRKAVIGLVRPDADQNSELKDLLAETTRAAAWLYIDFPRLGTSLAEMPALNSMIYEGEEGSLDEESAKRLKNDLSAFGRVFITCESASSGSALCYY
jgi:hypothetical protein